MAALCNCGWTGLLAEERDPCRHIMAERGSEKAIEASFLWMTLAVGPILPDAEKTRGEKQPCSISLTRWSWVLSFLARFFCSMSSGGDCGRCV